VCVVDKGLRDWNNPRGRQESADQLRVIDTRVVMYDELLQNARNSYDDFLRESEGIGRVRKMLNALVPTPIEP
jgi:hypothetical protein